MLESRQVAAGQGLVGTRVLRNGSRKKVNQEGVVAADNPADRNSPPAAIKGMLIQEEQSEWTDGLERPLYEVVPDSPLSHPSLLMLC